MRPPHYTGEDVVDARQGEGPNEASMRPPHYTGEDKKTGLAGGPVLRLQ